METPSRESWGRRSEVGGRRSEVGGRRSEVGGRRSQVAGRRSQVAGRRSQVAGRRSVPTLAPIVRPTAVAEQTVFIPSVTRRNPSAATRNIKTQPELPQ
jgi:hypothetical protein